MGDAFIYSFTRFKTGDVAQRVGYHGYYQILGRNSIDIIKTGGEKVSALEIEREILSCNFGVLDVAVVGIPDPEWGQKVAAVVVLEDGKVGNHMFMLRYIRLHTYIGIGFTDNAQHFKETTGGV